MTMRYLDLNSQHRVPLLANPRAATANGRISFAKTHAHPQGSSGTEDATVYFIGTATTLIEWGGFRILTDPNFLHTGDHVHLGPGVNATRRTNPATELHELPPVDCILLSHYHEDHFDRVVEDSLNREFPIITTSHAAHCLTSTDAKDEPFRNVTDLSFFESALLNIGSDEHGRKRMIKITGMPGKHVPPGPISIANDFLQAVPPTNGWLVELGYASGATTEGEELCVGYRVYISGDTLLVDELKEIPRHLQDNKLDLMLVHLGGTTIPGPSLPLLMVTMDARQGVELMQMMKPDVTIPIHYDDYNVFMSPLADFEEEVREAGLQEKVVYLDRGEAYKFAVR